MKFIGQYIQSLIARFRNDVYLEDISTGTIASGSNLGLDSNNKIVKATSTSHDEVTLAGTPDYITISGQEITRNAIDLTADVTGVLPSANLDADTSHLSVAQTFTGAKTFGTTTKLIFRDANSYIHSPTANDLKVSATDILLDAAGPVYLDAGAGNKVIFQEAGTTIADVSAHHSATYFNMYENEGASTDDYFEIKTAAAGATTITTVDGGGTEADLDFAIDGTFSVASTGIDIATNGTITNATWQGSSIATTYTAAKVTSIVAGDGIDVSAATGDVTVTAETATDSNPGVVELATTAEAVTGTDTARAVTPAGLKARVSQIINLKGYAVLQNDVYDFANPFNTDDEAPFQIDVSYGSGTIDSSTEVSQSKLFRAGGFHVPFACTVSDIQAQITCNNAGNVSIALVEYKPSSAGGDTNDYPRTVYETVVVASENNNNKVSSTTIATADLDATAVPAGSHLMIMVKGDGTSAGGTAVISVAVGLSW